MADKAAGGKAAGVSGERRQLHVAYGNALLHGPRLWLRRETTEAFARARESAAGDEDASERLAADYGLWAGSFVRGELSSMRAHAAAFLSDVEARPNSPRPESLTAWPDSRIGSPASTAKRENIWNGALALFEPGATTIWHFASDRTPASLAMLYLALTTVAVGRRRARGFSRPRR